MSKVIGGFLLVALPSTLLAPFKMELTYQLFSNELSNGANAQCLGTDAQMRSKSNEKDMLYNTLGHTETEELVEQIFYYRTQPYGLSIFLM